MNLLLNCMSHSFFQRMSCRWNSVNTVSNELNLAVLARWSNFKTGLAWRLNRYITFALLNKFSLILSIGMQI